MRGEVRAGDPAASLAMRSPGETATLSVPCVFPMHAFTIHSRRTCPLVFPKLPRPHHERAMREPRELSNLACRLRQHAPRPTAA